MFQNYKEKWLEAEQRNETMARTMREFVHDLNARLFGISGIICLHAHVDYNDMEKMYQMIAPGINHLRMMTGAFGMYYFGRLDPEEENCNLPMLLYYLLRFDEGLLAVVPKRLNLKPGWEAGNIYVAMGYKELRACVETILKHLEYAYEKEDMARHDIKVDILHHEERAEITFIGPEIRRREITTDRLREATSQAKALLNLILKRRDSSIQADLQGNTVVFTLNIPLLKIKQ